MSDNSSAPESKILVAKQGAIAQVRVCGRATFKLSADLREFCSRAMRQGVTRFIFDFTDCTAMDSTFMGTIAGNGLDIRGRGEIVLVNVSDSNRRLLDGLGVSRLFQFRSTPKAEINWNTLCSAVDGESAQDMAKAAPTVLAAHQTLMQVAPENIPKFKTVVEMLSAELSGK
jgi:anti-anti-sigma regulatory factor